jgi:hypothetical protein
VGSGVAVGWGVAVGPGVRSGVGAGVVSERTLGCADLGSLEAPTAATSPTGSSGAPPMEATSIAPPTTTAVATARIPTRAGVTRR